MWSTIQAAHEALRRDGWTVDLGDVFMLSKVVSGRFIEVQLVEHYGFYWPELLD